MNYAVTNFDTANSVWRSAGGESEAENEDSVEYESEASDSSLQDADPLDEGEMPKFRHLVRAKKLELKAQYGKAHLKTWTTSERKCLGGLRDVKGDGKPPFWDPNINCANINVPHVAWVWGWRKKWREFKQQGGLAQLKRQSQGLEPIPSSVPAYVDTPVTSTNINTVPDKKNEPKLDLPKVKQAGMGTNIILSLLVIGLAVGATKFIK